MNYGKINCDQSGLKGNQIRMDRITIVLDSGVVTIKFALLRLGLSIICFETNTKLMLFPKAVFMYCTKRQPMRGPVCNGNLLALEQRIPLLHDVHVDYLFGKFWKQITLPIFLFCNICLSLFLVEHF